MPDGGEDKWHFNFSAAVEDVRMSYSETVVAPVVALAMLNRYGLDEWSTKSLMSYDDRPVSDLHIPTVIFQSRWGWNNISNISKMRCIAYALDFQNVIERHAAAAADSPCAASWIAASEDDIVLTTLPVQAHKRLVRLCTACPAMLKSCMWNGVLTCVNSRVFTQSTR